LINVSTPESTDHDARLARANAAVRDEMACFRAALPELLRGEHAGRWIVFREGRVCSAHDSSDAAYRAGVEAFGIFGGQVIVRVEVEVPRYVSARHAFGVR
jgi:hypothetical protein